MNRFTAFCAPWLGDHYHGQAGTPLFQSEPVRASLVAAEGCFGEEYVDGVQMAAPLRWESVYGDQETETPSALSAIRLEAREFIERGTIAGKHPSIIHHG